MSTGRACLRALWLLEEQQTPGLAAARGPRTPRSPSSASPGASDRQRALALPSRAGSSPQVRRGQRPAHRGFPEAGTGAHGLPRGGGPSPAPGPLNHTCCVGQPRPSGPVYGKHLAAIIHSAENRAAMSAATGTREQTGHYLHIKAVLTPTPPQGSLTNTDVSEPAGRRTAEVRGQGHGRPACTEPRRGAWEQGASGARHSGDTHHIHAPRSKVVPQRVTVWPGLRGDSSRGVTRTSAGAASALGCGGHPGGAPSSLSSRASHTTTTTRAVSRANLAVDSPTRFSVSFPAALRLPGSGALAALPRGKRR